jgi:hypothetical protein
MPPGRRRVPILKSHRRVVAGRTLHLPHRFLLRTLRCTGDVLCGSLKIAVAEHLVEGKVVEGLDELGVGHRHLHRPQGGWLARAGAGIDRPVDWSDYESCAYEKLESERADRLS